MIIYLWTREEKVQSNHMILHNVKYTFSYYLNEEPLISVKMATNKGGGGI